MCDTGSGATVVIMSHTYEPWPDRAPMTLLLTAYRDNHGEWKLLLQEHNNTVSSALRPHYVVTQQLWTSGKEGIPTNRDLLLAVQDAITKLLNPMTAQGAVLNRSE